MTFYHSWDWIFVALHELLAINGLPQGGYVTYTLGTYPRGPNFGPFRSMSSCFWNMQLLKIRMHWITSKWTWTVNSQKYPYYTKYFSTRPKFWTVSFYDQLFSRCKVVKNQKCTELLQNNLNHLNIKSTYTLYTRSTHPRGPEVEILVCFVLSPVIFEIQGCWKSECTEWPQNELNSALYEIILNTKAQVLSVCSTTRRFRHKLLNIGKIRNSPNNSWPWKLHCEKYPAYTKISPPEAQIFFGVHFTLRPAIFEIQCCRKSECTEWPQNELNIVKNTLYILNNCPKAKFWFISVYDQLFSRYKVVINWKNWNARNNLGMKLNTWQSKFPCIH